MDFSKEDKELEEMLKRNQVQHNKDIQEGIKRYSDAKDISVVRAEMRKKYG